MAWNNNGIVDYLKTVALCGLLSLVVCLVINPVWGFYDSYGAALLSGSITGQPITQTFHLGIYPLAKLIGGLHGFFPSFPWSAVILLLSWVYLQSVFIALILRLTGIQTFSFIHTLFYWFASMLLLFGVAFIEMSGTGIGILISAISIIGLWYINTRSSLTGTLKVATIIYLLFGYLLGFSFRVESGLGGSLMGVLFIAFAELSPLKLIKVMWLPSIFAVIFFFQFYRMLNSHPFFRDVEPMVFYVTDSKNTPDFKPTDSLDALKIELVKASMLIDTTYLNYNLYKRLSDQKWAYEKTLTDKPSQVWAKIKKVAGVTIADNRVVTAIYFLLLLGAVLFAYSSNNKKLTLQLVGANLTIWSVIAFLAYSMKMEKWHYIPLLQSAGMVTVLLLATALKHGFPSIYNPRFLAFVAFPAWVALLFLDTELKQFHRGINEKKAIADNIFNGNNHNLVFMDVATREVLDDVMLSKYQKHPNLYFYDMAQLPFLPQYQKHLNQLCNCNSHKPNEFFAFLKTRAVNIHYYSSGYRVALITKFLHTFYNIDITFEPVETIELKENSFGSNTLIRYKLVFK